MLSLWMFLLACRPNVVWPEAATEARCEPGGLPSGEAVLQLHSGGKLRQALLFAPPVAGPHDVVVNLHEFRSEPRRQAHYSGWVPYAAAQGVLLVVPDGKAATWNAGGCCGKAVEQEIDDIAFLDALAAKVAETGCTSDLVVATGIGNGAMMAHRWACESDVPDAVISVGGALQLPSCAQTRPIPLIHYYGTLDELYPADGSKGTVPLETSLKPWLARNQVVGEPTESVDGPYHCRTWTGAAPVVVCEVQGMADLWPGASGARYESASPIADATAGAYTRVKAALSASP